MGTEISAAHRLKTLSGLILLCQLVISHAGNQAQPTYRASIEILNPPAFVSQGHVLLVLYNCERHQVVHLDVLVSSLTKTEVGVFHKRWTCSPGDTQVKEVKLDFPDQMVYREDYFLRHSIYISDVLLRAWMSEYPGDINIPEKSTYKSASVKTFHFIQALPPYSRPYKVRQETLSWDQNLIWKLRKDRIPQCGAEEEVVHFLDFPYACTGEIFGVLRVLEPYKDGVLERRRQHFIGSPRCSFLVWVFLVRPCATRFCGVLYHLNEGHQYITPTILLEDTGHLHVQVELLSGESQAFRSFSSLPLLKWCQIQLTFDFSQSTLRIQCGEKSSNMTYRFTQNALLSDTVGSFIFGGSQYVPGINGFFGPIVYYRNKVLPTNHQTPLPKLLANLEFSDWFHKCEAFKEECLEKYEQFLLLSRTKDNTDSCSDVYHELVTRYKEVSASLECTEWESPPPPHRAAVTRLLRRAGLRGVLGAQGKFAYKLMNDLFANYSNALRPVEDMDKVMNVTLQVTLSQIIDMDERNQILMAYLWIRQVWFDAYLRWNKDDYDGLDTIRIPSSYVWRPDIVLYNNADDQFTGSMETNVVIRYDGQIMWDSPAITKSSCKVDVSFFPFDGQQCRLTFGSWTYNGNQIDILNHLDTADLTDFVENVEWEILGMPPAKKNVITYGCCSEPYPDVTYTLMLKRRASFYIFNLLLPCVMISFLAPLGFYLPADSGEKVSLGVTVLLALTVFQLLVAESMPPSENVPLIGKYYIATMTMITASTALTIFIMNIHHCGPEAKPVPKWAKKFILQYMSRVFFVYEVGESCKRPKPDPEPEKMPKVQVMNGQAKREEPTAIFKNCPENDGLKVKEMTDEQDLGHGNASNIGDSTWKDSGQYVNSEHCRYSDCPKTHCLCHNERLLKNVEYMANCFREQKAAQIRTGEWKKVAKVMDRFFMWVFFIMVFFMSVLIMGKAI